MISKFIKYVFIIGLFISPFIFWPSAKVAYEVPRVWFILRWIETMTLLGVIGIFTGAEEKKKDITLIALVGAYVIIALIASIFGVDLTKSMWGNYYRIDGLFTLFHLTGLFFILMLYWEKSWEALTALSIVGGALGVSILQLIFHITTFGQPNFTAGYLAVALPFLFYFKRFIALRILAGTIMILAIVTTSSIGSLLGVLVGLFSWILLNRGLSKKKLLLIFAALALIGAIFAWMNLQKGSFIAESRERIIIKGSLAFTKRPIFGWGIANYDHAFDSIDWPIKLEHDVYVDKAHSTLMETLVTTGVLGFLGYVGILGRLFQRLIRERIMKNILFIALLVYIIHAQTNIISIAEELIFWIILGIIASTSIPKHKTLK